MRAYNYCKVCGERNAAGVSNCAACSQPMARSNPVNSSSFRSPTMVIFDIDDTILNVSQRYKDSSRGGYTNKDGSPKKKSTFETAGKARKRAQEFLFSPDNLRKDTAIPGALGLANELAAQGHVIAYVTARNAKFRDVTRNQLEDKGFPIFKDDSDMELLFLKARVGESTPKYKEGVYAKLLASYDVRMVFDDMKENLQAAVSQGITGVYPSIQDYTKYQVKSNPWYTGSDGAAYFYPDEDSLKYGGTGDMDPDAEAYDSAASHADPSGMGRVPLENPPLNCGCGKTPCMTYGGLRNPGTIQSKVESILVKEGGAAGLKPLKAAFPKGTTKAQATAAIAKMSSVYQHPAGDYILKNPVEYSEDYMVPRDIHRLGEAADSLEDTYDEQDVPEWWKSKLSVTARDADTLADSLDYVALYNPSGVLPMMSGEPSGKHTKLGVVFSEVFIGRNVIKDVGEGIQAIYRGLVGGRTSMAEKRMAMAVASMQKELSDRAKELGGNAVANIKVDYELPQGTASVTIIASADAIKMTRPPKKNPNYSIDEDFERMKQMAYDVRSKEAQGEEVNGREWWNQQIPWIEKRYGTEPLNVTWAMPLNTDGFDPKDKSQEFDDNGVKPLHFLNQLKRIPMTKQPTPERIMQIALNIGQGQASGSVETDFTLDDFIIRQNPYPLNVSVQVKGYRNTAGALVMKGKKFLILQRSKKETSKHGLWELPGGKVEKGETMRETALIETQEEAGLDIKLEVNLGSHIDHKRKKVYHAFIATPKKGQKVKLSEEHVSHKWVTPEEVMAMPKKKVSHHLRYFLEKEGETIRSNPFGLFKKKEKPSAAVLQGVSLYREIWESEEKQRKEDAEYDGEKFTPRTLTASSWDDDYSDIVGNVIAPQSIHVDWSYMEELFPLAKYLEGTLSINYYDIHGIKLKDFDTLKEAVDSKGDYDNIDEGFSRGVPSDQSNYMVMFTKRNLKRFQKLLDDPQRVPPKPKPVKPTPAIEKKLLAYNNALIEYSDEYERNEGESIEPLSIGQKFVFDREPMSDGPHIYMIYDKDAMNGMFAVLKQVGYKISDINTGESVTWKEFMKDPRSLGDRFGRYLTATETEHHKLVGYLQYLADEGKINGRTVHYTYKDGTSSGWRFQFVFGEVMNNTRSNPTKPKAVKPTPAIEKKIVAWYNGYHEAINSRGYYDKSFTISQYIGLGKYMDGRDAQPITFASNATNGYEAVKGMFAVLKEVGYTPEWMGSVPDGKPVTWAKFMKQGTFTSNGKKAWDFTDAYLTVKENKLYGLKISNNLVGYNKLMGYLQYLAKEGKIKGQLTRYGLYPNLSFEFDFNEVKANPRSNPPKNKIEKGKKLYKHMNGKDPEKIETKKIDMGDVWYQVGEGGCWQIGYMSGKETGKSEQKYTHAFNEETKDGNFPKLYATMPENGKPMLIITGGTWKIRTDDKGVAWIYD